MVGHVAVDEGQCSCGWRPEGTHGERFVRFLLEAHIEFANDQEPVEDDR